MKTAIIALGVVAATCVWLWWELKHAKTLDDDGNEVLP